MEQKVWTNKEITYTTRNLFVLSEREIGEKLGRTPKAVNSKLRKLFLNGKLPMRQWKEKEDEILLEHYGVMDIKDLEIKLFRTEDAIRTRMIKLLGTKRAEENSGNYTAVDITKITGLSQSKIGLLAKNEGLPRYQFGKRFYFDFDAFWDYMENNEVKLAIHNIDDEDLFGCPQWYIEKVAKLKREKKDKLYEPWTPKSINLVKELYYAGNSIEFISEQMNRSVNSIKSTLRRYK
jgi:hypothetical protein